ncbi:hypothetical protein F2P79_008364 [Pimephales promelas]|nr:hypothetical protein F2P79_008364 [Pimephales promelas]
MFVGERIAMARMFCVVQLFDGKKSVSVVPQSWYNDGFTFWPNYTNDERINKAVKFAEVPGHNWSKHPVRLLKTYGDFLSAWQGMKQSLICDTSELDSDDENEAVGRGKRTPKPMHHYGDTEDSDREPAPKKAPRPSILNRPTSGSSLTSRCNQPAPGPSYFTQPPLLSPPVPSSCSPLPPLTSPMPTSFSPHPPQSPSRPPSFSTPPLQLFQSSYDCSSQINNADLSLPHPPLGMSSDGLASSNRATEVFVPSLNMGRSGKEPIICTHE